MMCGLGRLPDFAGDCWRSYNHGTREQILKNYPLGRPIQWGAFTSVTTDLGAAKSFAPDTRVVFKIAVTSGRDINAYSFFPQEGEILLSPSHRFTVRTHDHRAMQASCRLMWRGCSDLGAAVSCAGGGVRYGAECGGQVCAGGSDGGMRGHCGLWRCWRPRLYIHFFPLEQSHQLPDGDGGHR